MILNSAIVEVIIGMVFVYSLLSILVTQINMVISNVLNLRAKHLKKAVKDLLLDPTIQARFLTHPLICLVNRPLDPNRQLSAQGAERVVESNTSQVTWIEPDVFADVLIDLVSTQTNVDRDLYAPLLRVANTVLDNAEKVQVNALVLKLKTGGSVQDELRSLILNLRDPADRQALLQALTDIELVKQEFRTDSADMIALMRGLRTIQNADFQRALDALLTTADNIEDARKRLEKWFDNNMDQVSDNFRRFMQYISLGVGLAMALLLNVDTLQVGETLWNDPALRAAVAATASSSLQTGQLASQIALIQPQPEATQQPFSAQAVGAESTPEPNTPQQITEEDVTKAQETLNQSVEQTVKTIDDLLALRLPIGWGYAPVVASDDPNLLSIDPYSNPRNLWNFWPGNNPGWLGLVIKKLVGIILTTIAVSQGAPFWFDLLNRIARGRTTS